MNRVQIDEVRKFNRTITERVGVLQDHYLGRDRAIGEARLLWEIGNGQGWDVRRLRDRLGLDSGYISRLLHSLGDAGLVTVRPDPQDRRVRTVELTEAGRAERATLDMLSDDLAASLLAPLNDKQRATLTTAMADVTRLLTAATVTLHELDPDHPDAQHCLRSYYAELHERFETGFDPLRSTLPDPAQLRAPAGIFLVARLHGEPVGCVGLKFPPDGTTAEIKRMWVAPTARGLGLARRLLAELESQALTHGRTLLRLDTNTALTAAINLYRSAGFYEIPAFNDDLYAQLWFEKRVTTLLAPSQ
jgi:DNA-binding MarR family transcriptional regulator/GNAT superfamily N-acetyltransferase